MDNRIETILKDVVNIGLGAAEKVKDVIAGDRNFALSLDEIKAKGAASNSELATKVRSSVDQALAQLEEARVKVDQLIAEGQSKLTERLNALNLPNINADELKSRFDQYAADLQTRLNQLLEQAKPVLDNLTVDELRKRAEEIIGRVRNSGGGAGGAGTTGVK